MRLVTESDGHELTWWARSVPIPQTCAGGALLALLVRTEVKWVRWAPLLHEPADRRPWERHREFLTRLVQLREPDLEPPALLWGRDLIDPGSVDPCSQKHRGSDKLLASVPAEARWTTSPEDLHNTITAIADGIRDCSLISRDAACDSFLLNNLACRVYLPLRPFRTDPPRTAVHGCVDLRFGKHGGGIWLYVTVSMWSTRPKGEWLAPRLAPATDPPFKDARCTQSGEQNGANRPRRGVSFAAADSTSDRSGRMATVRATLDNLDIGYCVNRVTALVDGVFVPRTAAVFRGEPGHGPSRYQPPRFWIAACFRTELGSPLDPPCTLIDEVMRGVLVVPNPSSSPVVSRHAVIPSGPVARVPITVLRRLVPDAEAEGRRSSHDAIPHYVLIPARTGGHEDQEHTVRELIHRITDDEAHLAHQLFDLSTELGIDDGLVAVYDAVADRASKLWDQLAMFLPDARGRTLDEVHRLIGLLHVGMLQGIADLDSLARKAEQNEDQLKNLGGPDAGDVDDRLVDICGSGPETGSLGRAVREAQHLADSRRWAGDVVSRVRRTRDSYSSLHQAIANAFDERRVRETDKVGKLGLWVALALALAGLVSEGWGRVLATLTNTESHRQPWLYFGLAVVLLVGVLLTVFYRASPSGGGGADFDRRYRQLRGYLGACRTERLDHLYEAFWIDTPADVDDPPPDAEGPPTDRVRKEIVDYERRMHDRWDREDRTLARRCAAVLDDVLITAECPVTEDLADPRRALPVLDVAVQRWLLAALFASERPRALWRYPLPRLLLLYRYYVDLSDYLPGIDSSQRCLVSDADLTLALGARHAITAKDQRDVVERWGVHLGEAPTARDALRSIERTGIRPGLSRAQADRVIEDMMKIHPRTGGAPCPDW